MPHTSFSFVSQSNLQARSLFVLFPVYSKDGIESIQWVPQIGYGYHTILATFSQLKYFENCPSTSAYTSRRKTCYEELLETLVGKVVIPRTGVILKDTHLHESVNAALEF